MKSFLLFALFVSAEVLSASPVSDALARPQLKYGSGTGAYDVWGAVYARIWAADSAADAAWLACRTSAEVEARAARMRADVIASLGGFPERTPLNVRVTGRVVRNGYAIEKILFESRPHHYVSAHVFVPANPAFKPPYPALVIACGHSLGGKDCEAYQRGALQAAQAGILALIYDPVEQGERLQEPLPLRLTCCTGHNHLGRKAALLGWNAAQFRIWDGLRAFDVLAARPDVDATRLAVAGHSGGGTLSAYLMALEPRAFCGAPSGFVTTLRDVVRDIGPQDAEQNIFGQLAFGFNHLGTIMLRAPKPTLHVCSYMDFFSYDGARDTYACARTLYDRLGAGERLAMADATGCHHWHESTRTATMQWLRHWLKDEKDFPAAPDMTALRPLDSGFNYAKVDCGLANSPEEHVTPTGRVMDLPDARSVYDLMRDELDRVTARRSSPTPAAVRQVTGIDPDAAGKVTAVEETRLADGTRVRQATLVRPGCVPVPTVAFMPPAPMGDPVLLTGLYTNRVSAAPRVAALLAAHRPVMVAEVRACGETGTLKHNFYGVKAADEEIAVMYYLLGESLIRHRAEDILAAAAECVRWAGVTKCALEAEGRAAIPAAHAWYLGRSRFSAFAATGTVPKGWTEIVRETAATSRFADVVHGALRTYDWTDLVQ